MRAKARQAVSIVTGFADRTGEDPRLAINGCAFCIHMHTRDARSRGESEERLYLLDAGGSRRSNTARERAALAWTEALTLVAQTHAPDDVYEDARRHFSEAELVKLTLLTGAINAWNRIAIGFRLVPPSPTIRRCTRRRPR